MQRDDLAQNIGELKGLMAAATSERNNLYTKIGMMETAIGKIDVIIAQLDHMRSDYHARFGDIQKAYGEFFAQIKDHDIRLMNIETGEKVNLAAQAQKKLLANTLAGAMWALIISMVGGLVTLFVQWWARK